MKSILDILTKGRSDTDEILKQYKSKVQVKRFKKGKILQHEGAVSSNVYFVKNGLLRSFVIDNKGKEHIFMFAPEGWLLSDFVAQTNNTPSDLFIDALEDVEVEVFNRDFLESMSAKNPENAKEGAFLLARRNAVLQKRVIMLMSATALARYQHFLETYPNIVQRVPQKMIASYLGITPEALSKIRGDIVKTK